MAVFILPLNSAINPHSLHHVFLSFPPPSGNLSFSLNLSPSLPFHPSSSLYLSPSPPPLPPPLSLSYFVILNCFYESHFQLNSCPYSRKKKRPVSTTVSTQRTGTSHVMTATSDVTSKTHNATEMAASKPDVTMRTNGSTAGGRKEGMENQAFDHV